MCKAIDETTTNTAPAEIAAMTAATDEKKRVRFRASSIHEFERVTEPAEKELVWYTRQDFNAIKAEIGRVIAAKTDDDRDRQDDADFFCLRGLEFLKWNDDDATPSRKDRRKRYAKHVLVYQVVVSHTKRWTVAQDDSPPLQAADLMAAFCTKLSQDATQRARMLASVDEDEARQVYRDCRLIYRENGRELCMFGTRSSSLCRGQWKDNKYYNDGQPLLQATLQLLFSYNSWCRVIHSVRNSVPLLAMQPVAAQ